MIIYPNYTFSVPDKRLYTLNKGITVTPCPNTGLQRVFVWSCHLYNAVPLVSASYGASLHIWCSHVLRRPFNRAKATVHVTPSAPKQPTTLPRPYWASKASRLDARCVVLLTCSHLRRRRSASFGISEDESCSCETTLT
jgi:hypothetical protein